MVGTPAKLGVYVILRSCRSECRV